MSSAWAERNSIAATNSEYQPGDYKLGLTWHSAPGKPPSICRRQPSRISAFYWPFLRLHPAPPRRISNLVCAGVLPFRPPWGLLAVAGRRVQQLSTPSSRRQLTLRAGRILAIIKRRPQHRLHPSPPKTWMLSAHVSPRCCISGAIQAQTPSRSLLQQLSPFTGRLGPAVASALYRPG